MSTRILEGKVALVTGGGRGIGKDVSRALLKEGASVIITARTKSQLDESAQELSAFGPVFAVNGDGAHEDDVQKTVQAAIDHFGKIDILVNNAHASRAGIPLAETTVDDMNLSLGSGLWATFFFMKHCYPHLKASRGRVINFGSGAAISGQLGQTAYAAAKEGIRGMSRVAAREWGPDGITVNIILPFAETPSMLQWKDEHPDAYAQSMASVPMRKLADGESDIGRTIVFLCSDDAKILTGQCIGVDGGSTMRP